MINADRFGVTFSVKQCRNFKLNPDETLQWLLDKGFRRFRLMSYWNEHEMKPGAYDFKALDDQINRIEKNGGIISLCLGGRQPRWPENHWPEWAWKADKSIRSEALLSYIEVVVNRYKDRDCIIGYQLENEALLKAFGRNPEVDRSRLKQEYALVKRLDPKRPVTMSTSTSWGVPVRQPIPDMVGFSYYRIVHNSKTGYSKAFHTPLLHKARKYFIYQLLNRQTFIHELQCEPWGPTAIWKMSSEEQDKSMSPSTIKRNIQLAKRVKAYPIDLWGGEWWYWRHKQGDDSIWEAVSASF